MAFLSLDGVYKGYGPAHARTPVLENVSLHIQRGEFVAVVGYSGAGKTTLVSLLAGLLSPDAGRVTIDGQPITAPGPERAVVFQNYSLLPWITSFENVYLAVDQVFPTWDRATKRAHTETFLAKVNLTAARDKRPSELSGGMRQRVALARALAMNPQVLLMDEPLSALDALTRSTLQDELLRIWAEDQKTVLLVTNDVDEALLLADRIVPLGMGPRATLGPDILVDLPRPRDRRKLNHQPRFKELRQQVIAYLLGPGRRRGPMPEIQPKEAPAAPPTESEVAA